MSYKWYWMNDNGWTLYDAKKSAELEKAYTSKQKSCNLDKERFVDLSLSWSEICKNFTNLTDKTMVGIQRRFDDHNKRRAVKREKDTSVSFFEDLEFAFLAQLQGQKLKVKDNEMISKVKTYGGKVVTSLSKTVDYVVVMGSSLDDPSAETQTAESLKIPIVSSNFITKCILEGKLIDHTSSILAVPKKKKKDESDEEEELEEGMKKSKKTSKKKADDEEGEEGAKKSKKTAKKKVESEEEEEEEEKPKKKSKAPAKGGDKKRKAESDEEEEEEEEKPAPKKKSKVDDAKPTTSTTSTTSTTTTTGSTINGLEILQPGSDWMGVCTDPVENNHYPFLLQVLKMERSKFEGFIFWKTLNDAQTKIRGKFAPNGNGGDLNIEIEEYEAVVGEEELELPMTYTGVLSGKSISGRVGDKSSKSTFKLDLIKSIPFKLRVPQVYKGTCKADTPFVLKISKREDEDVEGTIEWQVAPPTITKWRGTINDLTMTVEEYEVLKGDEEFLLRTWKLAVTQDETLSVKTVDNETFVVNLAK